MWRSMAPVTLPATAMVAVSTAVVSGATAVVAVSGYLAVEITAASVGGRRLSRDGTQAER